MTNLQLFERQKRDQEHWETLAMLAAERAAVELLRESYRALGQAAREAAEAMNQVRKFKAA